MHSAPVACDDDRVAYMFSSEGRMNYVFAHNEFPYEGFVALLPFVPTRQEIEVADSIFAARHPTNRPVFAQYGGVISREGDKVVAVNYIYRESRDHPDARCTWFFGLGPYFEENTRDDFINLSSGAPFVLKGRQ